MSAESRHRCSAGFMGGSERLEKYTFNIIHRRRVQRQCFVDQPSSFGKLS